MSRLVQCGAVIVPALVALVARLLTGPHPIDDAYITFRYARNMAEGLGLVYNAGEWVLGTTAPLWAIVLSGGYRLGFTDLPWLATLVSGLSDAVSAALLVHFSLRLGLRPVGAACVGLVWALNPMSIAFATGGMETSLFVVVTLAVLGLAVRNALSQPPGAKGPTAETPSPRPLAAQRLSANGSTPRPLAAQRPSAESSASPPLGARCIAAEGSPSLPLGLPSPAAEGSAAMPLGLLRLAVGGASSLPLAAGLAGIATALRPEGGLLVVALVGWAWMLRSGQTVRSAMFGFTPIAIGGLTLLGLYGNPLPNSVAAKQVAYQPAWPFENAIALVLQAGLPGWSTYLLGVLPTVVALVVAALGLITLVELARRALPWLRQQAVPWQPFAAFATLYLVFYVVVGLRGVRLFPWYLVPIEPFYLLAAAAGLARLGAQRSTWLAAALVLWQLVSVNWGQPLLPAGEDLAREQVLFDVGRELAVTLPPTAVVAAPEIGALGYASNLRILDTVGLVSPAALRYYPLPPEYLVTDNAIPPQLLVDLRPDVVVTLDAYARHSLLPDPAFQRAYYLDRAYPAHVWQSEELLVFRRQESQ